MTRVSLIPGDGIGPEIADATVQVLEAAGADIDWEVQRAGQAVYEASGELIPEAVYQSIEKNGLALKGPMTTPIGTGFRSANVALRKKYDLYANLRPIRSLGQVPPLFPDLDLVLFRENTEDLYAGVEEKVSDDVMHSIKIITRQASERIIRQAFDYAQNHQRQHVTVVTKANIMKLSDGLFLDTARQVAKDYPDIPLKEVLVDNMAMQLVINPKQFDVIVTENLYGDILSDLMAGLIGGLGLVPGANIGKDLAIFEAVHGSAPDIAGQGRANPTAMILSACLLLDYIGQDDCAQNIRQSLDRVLSHTENFTPDLGGQASTTDFCQALCQDLRV
ncbi:MULTISPECIES: isocitrate/isopropylmalate dehydrogenase family protein [unclassified Aerococcus]|uniref:isocitrate/isopropylmalate dehydrogenase family protein n=1 Tax=unclassified Aerococcus TaxID=2618060 RepID=UPI0008A4F28D|nr:MULTISPECIES: isocitrate/isopropylmalate family dehydrogenase [unclassified Aerococcus]MDK6369955.1 isocitrate/isopropylmalate family dehydrogenase [Aerococcus sp. UMB9870]MDK6687401.1 isocitrate/isopropylmalate family dehydrogenase [Aerococcus sp. UMB8623]OFR35644.1 isocitrate dehydrogenase [Aerococcus sp. HMSC061A03]OFT41354.1 isocitrate dehydrogenase [Aerococcus sp. HMSC06H08]